MKVVEIKKVALVQMVAAVYESKKLEALGFLGGKIKGNHFTVELAQPAQIAERKPSCIYYGDEWKRIREIISRNYDFLGGFHSHLRTVTQKKSEKRVDLGKVRLGRTDIATIKEEYPSGIEIIVAMNPSRRKMNATISANKITGYITNEGSHNYKIEIGVYYLENGLGKRKAELYVPKRHLEAVFG